MNILYDKLYDGLFYHNDKLILFFVIIIKNS